MKRLAERQEPAVIIPMIVIPIEVQIPLGVIDVEIRHIAITIRIDPGRTQRTCRTPSKPLPIESSLGCILFGKFISLVFCTKYFHFEKEPERASQQRITDYSSFLETFRIQPPATVATGCDVYYPKTL